MSRDRLAELFWGDRDDARARHSLREALSHLRRALGPDAIARRSAVVRLADGTLSVDVRELAAAHRAGAWGDVVRLYGGLFLDGVHTDGSHSLEDWSSGERARSERLFIAACARECDRLLAAHAHDASAALAERWLAAAPTSDAAAVALLRALAAPGTTHAQWAAERAYAQLVHRLDAEFGVVPGAVVAREAAAIAQRSAAALEAEAPLPCPAPVAKPIAARADDPAAAVRAAVSPAAPRRGRRRRLRGGHALAAVLLLTVASVMLARRWAAADGAAVVAAAAVAPSVPTLVVAGIEPPAARAEDAWLRDGLPQLIGAALARERVIDVVDAGRVRDVLRRARRGLGAASLSTDDALDAARRLGAAWLVSGATTYGDGRYFLDLSLRDVATGRVRRHIAVTDSGLFTAVARVTAQLVPVVDDRATAPHLEGIETNSVDAYRAFVLAARLVADGRSTDAIAALDAAVAADSGFVAAIVQRRISLGPARSAAAHDSAERLMHAYARARGRASDFDRLQLDAFIALHDGDHARAESLARALVARYPRDPRADMTLVNALSMHGRFAEAADAVTRALALDSLSREGGTGPCASCAGYGTLAVLATLLGDLPRAEAAARRAVALEPERPSAWAQLGNVLAARRRDDEALAATRRALALAPRETEYAVLSVERLIEARQLDAADSTIRSWLVAGDGELAQDATLLRAMVLRERGRHADAARLLVRALRGRPDSAVASLLVAGNSLGRSGDAADAALAMRLIEAAVPHRAVDGPGMQPEFARDGPRAFAWPHALLADALYLAGDPDTTRMLAIADSVEVIGARSYLARDWRLHFHVRGLVAMRAGRWADAERAFQRARWGPAGWTRTVVELARAQLAQGETRAAVATLRDAYTGPIGAMGLYEPRSDIDYWMARAFAAADMPDSARRYAGYVRRAWAAADPPEGRRLLALGQR